MRELLRTTDILMVSYVRNLLGEAGIAHHVFDENFSILEGSIGIIPRRVMVAEEDMNRARTVLWEAGLEKELKEMDR